MNARNFPHRLAGVPAREIINPETGWPVCATCGDEAFHPRCPECHAIPLDRLHASCREPLRQIASDMCARGVERELRFTMDLQAKRRTP